MSRAISLGLTALLASGCGDDHPGTPADAAAPDAYPFVDAVPLSDGNALAWVDFATGGCELVVLDGAMPTTECRGAAPLAVRFAPVAPEPIAQYLWTFGDGAVSSATSPEHVFTLPGRYDVSLAVSGAGGTASTARTGFVVVTPAALGAACSDSRQCGDERSCLCGDGAACEGAWSVGACAASCEATPCGEGTCAQLAGAAPWSGRWCLPSCDGPTEDDCDPGLACATVPGDNGWTGACAPLGALAGLGESCAGPTGLDDARCASGLCAPLGLRGACSADCDVASCPIGSACATFAGPLGKLCLADCDEPTVDCDDPWLDCVAAGGAGDLGFTGAGLSGTYCAPDPCTGAADCPAGTCTGGYCRAPL